MFQTLNMDNQEEFFAVVPAAIAAADPLSAMYA